MISRREFLAAPIAVASTVALLQAAPKNIGVKIGCQTNAWRIDPNNFDSLLAVLRQLKELGYEGYETGFRNVQGQFANSAAVRKQLEVTGLKFLGCHIFLDKYDEQTQIAPLELVQKIADGAASLGAERLILSGGGLIRDGKVAADFLKRKADGLNAAGKYCRSKGIRLAYHNHGPEFEAGGVEIEGLYAQTDPALVDFLHDFGWAFYAKANVPEFFAKHHKRIVGMHLRDFKNGEQVPLGQGEFPIRELAAAIKKAKWTGWAINEEERLSGEKPGEKAVAPARQTMKQVFGK
ncbi:MAG: sugar phosphate isomerase/epimerase family protein [Acidobacteriota bacterium]|nr:sugar phosphate isomerase/epimerase family protein [Acidobacteriota bacterium]